MKDFKVNFLSLCYWKGQNNLFESLLNPYCPLSPSLPLLLFDFVTICLTLFLSQWGPQICRYVWVTESAAEKMYASEHFSALSPLTYRLSVSFPASPFFLQIPQCFLLLAPNSPPLYFTEVSRHCKHPENQSMTDTKSDGGGEVWMS